MANGSPSCADTNRPKLFASMKACSFVQVGFREAVGMYMFGSLLL